MASLRAQIFARVETKLVAVKDGLGWPTFIRNPRDIVGVDQMPAIVMIDGGDTTLGGFTDRVGEQQLEFSVGILAAEKIGAGDGETALDQLDLAFVAISDALLDPGDIQLGGLAIDIRRGDVSDPVHGRPDKGAQYFGGQAIDFMVRYLEREGDASTPAP